MILQCPNGQPVVVGPAPQTQVPIQTVFFDLVSGQWTVVYGVGYPLKRATGTIPPALLTALETRIQAAVETNEGWTPGSSTVVSP